MLLRKSTIFFYFNALFNELFCVQMLKKFVSKSVDELEPRPKKIDQFFGLFVYENDLLVECPSYDNGTYNDTRLQMQKKMCPEIKQLLKTLQEGTEICTVVIQDRPVHVFKIEIGNWDKAVAALNIVKEYLEGLSIPIIAMRLSWGTGHYQEILLNTTKASKRDAWRRME